MAKEGFEKLGKGLKTLGSLKNIKGVEKFAEGLKKLVSCRDLFGVMG